MGKPVFGLILGGILGIFDGLTALISAPEVKSEILMIVVGSMGKGLLGGVIIGYIAKKFHNLPLGVLIGGLVTTVITYPIASMPATNGNIYFWEILIPGMIVGLIVGYATQKHEPKRANP
jgi:MFS-type transporter involved in bile tolerance (Atg22 family)